MALQSSSRFGVGPRFGLEVVGLIGAIAAGVGIGALVFDGGSSESSSESPRVTSAPGPAEMTTAEFVAAAKAIHDSFMDALFGTYETRVTSAPGVAEMSEAEFVAAEKAIHDAYMDALFGPYVTSVTSAPGRNDLSTSEWVAAQKAIHDAYMDAMFGPYGDSEQSAATTLQFDVGAARAEHDRLIPVAN